MDAFAAAQRAARFAATHEVPPLPERKLAPADARRDKITRTDPVEKLVALCKRRLASGSSLGDQQIAALQAAGISVEQVAAEAAAEEAAPPPEIYGLAAAKGKKEKKRRKSLVASSKKEHK